MKGAGIGGSELCDGMAANRLCPRRVFLMVLEVFGGCAWVDVDQYHFRRKC